jgi:single-strand DNA-binding protein
VAPSLRKGQAVVITGRLQVREFDDREGRRRVAVDIDADAVGHDLSRGVAHFQRTFRSAGDGAEGRPEGLAMGEAIRAGLTDEDAPGPDAAGLAPAGPEGGEPAETSDDMFNREAIGELAGATGLAGDTELAGETELAGATEGAAAAAAPF